MLHRGANGAFSGLPGGAALAVIMLPTIIRTTEEMLKLVPATLREASLGLGAAEWKTSLSVLFPAAFSGIVTGFLLALARAAGETAPLLLTSFGNELFDIGRLSGWRPGPQIVLHHPLEHRQPAGQFAAAFYSNDWNMPNRPGPLALVLMLLVLIAQCHCTRVDPEPCPPHERLIPWR